MAHVFSYAAALIILGALILASSSANATTTIEVRLLGNSRIPSRVEVTLDGEGGSTTLPSKQGSLVFELPPASDGVWEEMLNVDADGNSVPLRVTRYHRQLERLSVPLYLDPSPPAEINNPQVEEIEKSQQGQESADENAIKYFKAAYAIGKITLVSGPFPVRVELAYFDRALQVTNQHGYVPVAKKAADAVGVFLEKVEGAKERIKKRLLDVDPKYHVSKLDYTRFERWTDMYLLGGDKLKSPSDRCVLVTYYLRKFHDLDPGEQAIVNKMLGYDDNKKWEEVRRPCG
jgi:hypothetical protein